MASVDLTLGGVSSTGGATSTVPGLGGGGSAADFYKIGGGSSGGSPWGWNPITDLGHAAHAAYDYLNPVGAIKGFAQGIASTVAEPIVNLGGAVADAAHGDFSGAGQRAEAAGQGVMDIGGQTITGLQNLGADVTHAVGTIPGLEGVQNTYDTFMQRENLLMSHFGGFSDTERAQLAGQPDANGYVRGAAPSDVIQQAEHGGLAAAVIGHLGTLAMVAGPVASLTGAAADTTTGAAASALEAGDQAMTDAAETKAAELAHPLINSIAEGAAHPYRFISEQTAGFLKANQMEAAGAALQGATDAVSGVRTPLPITRPDHMTPEDHAAAVASMDPQVAGAEAMTAEHTVATQPVSLFAEAGLDVPPGTTRFSRVGAPGSQYVEGMPNPSRASGTAAEDMGRIHTVDVPNDVAHTLPRGPNGEVEIPDEYIKSNGQERASGTTKLKVPNRLNDDGTMRTKAQLADDAAKLHEDERQAAENAPTLLAEDKVGAKIAMPPPAWAQRVAQALPDSVNRALGHIANGTVDKVQFKALQRNFQQFAERAQQHAKSSSLAHVGQAAANIIWSGDKTLDPVAVSQALGQEIIKRVNGDMLTQNFVKRELSPGDPLPEPILKALLEKAGANYPGVTEEMTANLTPEAKAQLEATIQAGVEQYKADSVQVMQTLLGTRYGARGLESTLLDPNEVVMSSKDVAMYRKAMGDLRREQVWRGKLPDLIQRNQQQAIQSAWHGNRIADSLVRLQDRIGINHQTIEDLHQGVAPGLKDDASIAATVHALLDDAARTEAGGGRWSATIDAGTGDAIHPTLGHTVATAHQATIDAARFEADPVAAITDALLHPHSADGSVHYDPNALWGGTDAHLTVSKSPDGSGYSIDITQHTLNGVPMNVMQASVLGEAFEQPSIHINASGEDLPLSEHPLDQAIASHYLDQIMDPGSKVNTMWNDGQATATAVGIPQHQLLREFTNRMLMDYAFAQRSSVHEIGDLFNAKYEVAEGLPRNAALFGTTVDMTTADGVENALKTYQGKQLTKILGWYNESHDYIEENYRGKTMPGTDRDAADVFYDLLAVTSVMASPLQNLGRALMGFSNLDELYRGRAGSALVAQEIMDKAMSLPTGVRYVKDINKATEREVGKGEGTAVSSRFLDTPEFRKLTNQTSMITAPKYSVIDILTGRLNLGTATTEDIDRMPEFWTGARRGLSDENLPPARVIEWAQRLGLKGKTVQHAADLQAQVDALRTHNPITDAEDVQRRRAEADAAKPGADVLEGGREVTPQESADLAAQGKQFVDARLAASSPNTLNDPALIDAAFNNVQKEWGGATVDAHNGHVLTKADAKGNHYAVTARLGKEETTIPIGSSRAVFDRAYHTALTRYSDVLDSDGGHLGIFRNEDTGKIEFDPVYHTTDTHTTEAVGTYSHSNGGAFNFRTENGHWTPHVAKSADDLEGQLRSLYKTKPLRPAYEQAMLEHTGSAGLAKLRSFRSNLADPEHSLNVTLDSVMAKLWGMDKTDWGKGTNYADKAQEIRDQAEQLSARLGRKVMPHEVQALLWVFTKEYVGTQDWSRLLAHHDVAMNELNIIGDTLASGGHVDPGTLKFLDDWKEEELGYSRSAKDVRVERKGLREKRTAGAITPEEQTNLDQLEQFPDRHSSNVRVDVNANARGRDVADTSGANYQEVQRNESPYDAKVLAAKEAQFVKYDKLKVDVQKLIADGTPEAIAEAKAKLSSYVAKRERSIKGDAEGGNFRDVGDKAIKQKASVHRVAADRLAQPGGYVPSPGASMGSTDALRETFNGQVRGVTMLDAGRSGRMVARLFQGADIATLVHEDMHLLRLMAPADEVEEMTKFYPHLTDATLTPLRRADEEKFVEDFMGYMAQKAHNGDMPWTRSPSAAFRSAAQTMDDVYASHLSTTAGQTIGLDVRNYWDNLLNPEIVKPSVYTDPLSSQYVKPVNGVSTTQRRWESDAQYQTRIRHFGEARQRSATLSTQKQALLQQQAKVDRATSKMMGLWDEGGEAGVKVAKMADAYHDLAGRRLGKVAERLGNPTLANVPRAWQPMVQSFQEMAALIREDPNAGEMTQVLAEIPDTFARVMQYAAEHGFEPTYVPEMTEERAAKMMYRHMNLSADPEMASVRKTNVGTLRAHDIAARNLEVLSAAQVVATKEMLQSKVIDFVTKYWAKPLANDQGIPPGFEAWDSARQGIITGREQTGLGRRIAATAGDTSYIIPKHVGDALRKMQEPYSRWGGDTGVPRFILKGGPTALWKNIMLTYSPTWYMKHFLGAVSNAVLAGAHWSDFRTAVKQAWTKDEFGIRGADLPDAVRGRSVWGLSDEEGNAAPGAFLNRSVRTTASADGAGAVLHQLNAKMRNIVKVTDGLGRAAVYASKIREGFSTEVAAEAAFTSLGDFGNLSAIERGLVATIMPFYPFQKAMFKIMARLPSDHPYASSIFMNVGQMHQQQLETELNGSIPDNLIGSDMIGGHLVNYAKLNPLIDTYKLVTPQGILSSVHPFIQLFLQDGLHAPTFNGKAGMGEYGQLVNKPAVGSQLADTFLSAPVVGAGQDVFGSANPITSAFVPAKTYTDAQWQALLKRIAKTAASIKTADKAGGYLTLDAVAPSGGGGSSGYGTGSY